jgi:hypothetical protein
MQERPEACTFPGQDDDEVVQILIYKHIFSVLPVFVVSIATFIGGLFLLAYAASGAALRIPSDFGATGRRHDWFSAHHIEFNHYSH